VRVSPCQTFVPIFRNFAIAQIKPATRTRVDLGLALRHYSGKLPKRRDRHRRRREEGPDHAQDRAHDVAEIDGEGS
jgi:hypothetical protein